MTDNITWQGNTDLLNREKTAFISSRLTPLSLSPLIQRWAMTLNADHCIICGNESETEQMIFSILLLKRIPTILLLANVLPPSWPLPIAKAINEGRLLIGTHCIDLHTATRRSAIDRNRLMIHLAQHIVVGYCTDDGEIAQSTRGRTDVTYLTYPHTLKR